MELKVNGQLHTLDAALADPAMPLLWALRDLLGLTGTKYGCGIGLCGACTVHVDGRAVRSCSVPLGSIGRGEVRTIEGLARDGALHPVQRAWLEHQVPQCGYCHSGVLMAVAALLQQRADPSDAEIDAAVTNLCRCGTTPRMRAAIRAAARLSRRAAPRPRAPRLRA